MIEENPTSQRWKDICEIKDEQTQSRVELEKQVYSYETEINKLRKEVEEVKKDILSMKFVQKSIKRAREDEWSRCNTAWSGMQEGF